jgi:hypothetical protein
VSVKVGTTGASLAWPYQKYVRGGGREPGRELTWFWRAVICACRLETPGPPISVSRLAKFWFIADDDSCWPGPKTFGTA